MITWRFGGALCLNPQKTRDDLEQKHGYRSPWIDRCNSWTYRRGFRPSRGYVLMQVGQVRSLVQKQNPRHTLEIKEDSKLVRFLGLSIVRSEAIFATVNSGLVHDETPVMVEIADARHEAMQTDINGQINVRGADSRRVRSTGDLTLEQVLNKLWERIKPVFGLDLVVNVAAEPVPIENLEFVGMNAWEAFAYVCELAGCSFRIRPDSRPEVFSLKNEIERSNELAIRSAVAIDSTGWIENPDLPENIRVFTELRDYQWQKHPETETAQDYHRLEPTYSRTLSTLALVPRNGTNAPAAHDDRPIAPLISSGTTKVLWGTIPLITRDNGQAANKADVDMHLGWVAQRWAAQAISTRLNATFTYVGIVNAYPDSRYGSVIFRNQEEALTTTVASGELRQEFPGRWSLDIGVGRPNMRDRQPYGREIYCRVLPPEQSQGEEGQEPRTVPAGAHCRVEVLSGLLGPRGVIWNAEKIVEAVNGLDRAISPQFAYAKWNYQLGGGGAWVIVAVAGASGELADWCSVCIEDFREIDCVDDPSGMSVNKRAHLRLVEYNEVTSNGTVQRFAIDLRPGPENTVFATLGAFGAKDAVSYWTNSPAVRTLRVKQGFVDLQSRSGVRTLLGPSNSRDEARHRMPGPANRSGQYVYAAATGPGGTADWGWLGPGAVGQVVYSATCFDPADIIDHLCDYMANCTAHGNAWGAGGKPSDYASPCQTKTFTVTNGLIIGGEGLTKWEERYTSKLQDPEVEHFNPCGSQTVHGTGGGGLPGGSPGEDPGEFPLPEEPTPGGDDGTTGGVGPEDEQLGNEGQPFELPPFENRDPNIRRFVENGPFKLPDEE